MKKLILNNKSSEKKIEQNFLESYSAHKTAIWGVGRRLVLLMQYFSYHKQPLYKHLNSFC